MPERSINMTISIYDIKVGEKYGFDIRQGGNRPDYYVEAVCTEIVNVGDEVFVFYEDHSNPNNKSTVFSFNQLTRLVGPFSSEE